MKLARPDVFHPRIVLAGAGDDAGAAADDAGLVGALRRRGLHARWLAWDDPDTAGADLVILRAVAGTRRRAEFLAWTRRVRHLLNPPGAVAWNLDERYLRDLERDGVPTTDPDTPPDASLVFLAGERSHGWPVEPEFESWDLGHAALAAAAKCTGIAARELLCARVDLAGERLVGLDLVAPSLGWRRLDDAARGLAQHRFARAVESACERLGLGPLSHRRP